MASTVTNYSYLINEKYPVVGKKNDLQGFQTNWSNIKSSLESAGHEITELQNNGVYLTEDNDFNGNTITSATILNCTLVLQVVS